MPAPTVSAVTPNVGSNNGGASLTLTGTNFTGTTGVTIGGVAATNLVIVSATSITITAPAGSAGVASIIVTNASGTNGANSLFFYIGAGVPADTYIYLKGGRGDGFVPLWTGVFSDTLVNENSDAYRDIFPSSSTLIYTGGANSVALPVPTLTSVIYTSPVIVAPTYVSPNPIPGSFTGTTSASTSDEIMHTPPRQFVKVVTWRGYVSSGGLIYHYRLIDVLGVGSLSRDT